MTKEQAEALVSKKLPELKKLLCLDHVSFKFEYETLSESVAEVTLLPDYNSATIRLHAAEIKDAKELGELLLHELLHVVLIQFEGLFQHLTPELPVSTIQIAQRLNTEAQERVVAHLEKILGRI